MIVTGRARWLMTLCAMFAVYAIFRQHVMLFRFCVAILIWIGLEWFAFRYRCDVYLRNASVQRQVHDRRTKQQSSGQRAAEVLDLGDEQQQRSPESARVLWATRSTKVSTTFSLDGGWLRSKLGRFLGDIPLLPAVRATIHDLLPTGVELVEGDNGVTMALGNDSLVQLSYAIRPLAPGKTRFHGLRVVAEDLHGFFVAERFLRLPLELPVMPLAMDIGTLNTIRKRSNALPPPGMHTVGRAGPGSELMEIREYQPGDPPRSIAWKVSARRDELMCKQFESEVPVRCQLLVDMSRAIRLGYPGPCLGGELVNVAATIAFTLTSYRDPVGISLFDGERIRVTPPSASRRATLRAIDTLCMALNEPIAPVRSGPKQLMRSGYDIARSCYPEAIRYAEESLVSWWPSRAATRIRRRLAAILANHYQLGHHGMGELEGDDLAFSYWLQRFHTEHGAPYSGSLTDAKGDYLFSDRQKCTQLAQLLRGYAARGRDNELFVILADLTDDEYDLAPLMDAVKYAKARHHRVAVVTAWPPHVAGPLKRSTEKTEPGALTAERRFQERAYRELVRQFGKLGVPIAAAADDRAIALVLNQLEIIRTGRAVA